MTSRSTFRDKAGAVCYQKQLRDRYADEPTPPVPHLSVRRAVVRPVSRKLAEQIILKYEWLGTMGTAVEHHYGIFFGLFCAGVTTFAPSSYNLPSLAKKFKIDGGDLRYLSRGACTHWAPTGTNSKLIAWSLRLETQHGKMAVAFSDTDAGEIGTVYQASNWVYIGTGSIWNQWVSAEGKVWSFNEFTKRARTLGVKTPELRRRMVAAGWHEQKTNPKHRYVYLLDKKDDALRRRIEAMAQPYPKRQAPDAEASRHPATNGTEGGASPTPALHLIT